MTPERLLAHFDRISEAPDAIPRLRRFVLDLAVRGKLVEQSASDEPAARLVSHIQAERSKSTTNGKAKKTAELPPIAADEIPHQIPANWSWVRIREVTADRGQKIPDRQFTYIDVTAINKEVGIVADARVLTPEEAPSRARKIVESGDVVYSCVRPSLLNIAIVDDGIDPPPIASTAFAVINGFGLVLAKYLWIAFRSPYMIDCVEAKMRGQAYPAINDSDFACLPLPLPPLAEQRRIVAKVDELMALCDKLEAAQAERERRRDWLAAASLARLNKPADDRNEFQRHVRFHLDHLQRFTTRPNQISEARQLILSLAFQGCLTTSPTSSSAKDLYERILADRSIMFARTSSNAAKRKCPPPEPHERRDLPLIKQSWVWASADELCAQITDGEHIQPGYQSSGLPMLSAKHVRDGHVTLDGAPLIASVDFEKAIARCEPKNGDILIVSVGATTGRSAIVRNAPPFAIVRSVLLLKPLVSPDYFLRWLQTPWCYKWMTQASGASAQPHLYIRDLKRMPVPLATENEQHAIVAKIDELMAICDELESHLTTAETDRRRLLEAVLHEALHAAPSETVVERKFRPLTLVALKFAARFPNWRIGGDRKRMVKSLAIAQRHLGIDFGWSDYHMSAGPHNTALLKEIETDAVDIGLLEVEPRTGDHGTYYRYKPTPLPTEATKQLANLFGSKLDELNRLAELSSHWTAEQAELYATIYAVWNDLLIDKKSFTDAAVVAAVRSWSPEKKDKFTAADVTEGIRKLRESNLIPQGLGPRTKERERSLLDGLDDSE